MSRAYMSSSHALMSSRLLSTRGAPGCETLSTIVTLAPGPYIESCVAASRSSAARAKLEAYAALYADVLRGKRMCMCGILAAEYQTLPVPMRGAVIDFFDENQQWLAHVLAQGKKDKTLAFSGRTQDVAQGILSTL